MRGKKGAHFSKAFRRLNKAVKCVTSFKILHLKSWFLETKVSQLFLSHKGRIEKEVCTSCKSITIFKSFNCHTEAKGWMGSQVVFPRGKQLHVTPRDTSLSLSRRTTTLHLLKYSVPLLHFSFQLYFPISKPELSLSQLRDTWLSATSVQRRTSTQLLCKATLQFAKLISPCLLPPSIFYSPNNPFFCTPL